MATRLSDHFTLEYIAPLIGDISSDHGLAAESGEWTRHYGVYTLGGGGNKVGSVELHRGKTRDGGFLLEVMYDKSAPNAVQKLRAKMVCREDALATPLYWTVATSVINSQGASIPSLYSRRTGRIDGTRMIFDEGGKRREVSADRGRANNWALFEAAGRFKAGEFPPIHFTLLDDFDQTKPDQSISFRQTVEVMIKGIPVRLHAFDQLGRGVVPWVYWVDDSGRLLFAVSGIKAYILETAVASRKEASANG